MKYFGSLRNSSQVHISYLPRLWLVRLTNDTAYTLGWPLFLYSLFYWSYSSQGALRELYLLCSGLLFLINLDEMAVYLWDEFQTLVKTSSREFYLLGIFPIAFVYCLCLGRRWVRENEWTVFRAWIRRWVSLGVWSVSLITSLLIWWSCCAFCHWLLFTNACYLNSIHSLDLPNV